MNPISSVLDAYFGKNYKRGLHPESWADFYHSCTGESLIDLPEIPAEGNQYWRKFFSYAEAHSDITERALQTMVLNPLVKVGDKVVEDGGGDEVYDYSKRKDKSNKFETDAEASRVRSISFLESTTGYENRTNLIIRKSTSFESECKNVHNTFGVSYQGESTLPAGLDHWRLSPLNIMSIIELKSPSSKLTVHDVSQLIGYILNVLKSSPGRRFIIGVLTNGISIVLAYVAIDPDSGIEYCTTSTVITSNAATYFIDYIYTSEHHLGWKDISMPTQIRFKDYLGRGSTGWVCTIVYKGELYVIKLSRNTQALKNEHDAVAILNNHEIEVIQTIAPLLANDDIQREITAILGKGECVLVYKTLLQKPKLEDFTEELFKLLWNGISNVHKHAKISHCDLRLPNVMKRVININNNNNDNNNINDLKPNQAQMMWTLVDWSAARQVRGHYLENNQNILPHAGLIGSVVTCPLTLASDVDNKTDFQLNLAQEAESFVLFMLDTLCDDIKINHEDINYHDAKLNIDNTLTTASDRIGQAFALPFKRLCEISNSVEIIEEDNTPVVEGIEEEINEIVAALILVIVNHSKSKDTVQNQEPTPAAQSTNQAPIIQAPVIPAPPTHVPPPTTMLPAAAHHVADEEIEEEMSSDINKMKKKKKLNKE